MAPRSYAGRGRAGVNARFSSIARKSWTLTQVFPMYDRNRLWRESKSAGVKGFKKWSSGGTLKARRFPELSS